ncbi:hypothetical protein ACJRO7_007180 [Eucalyptus globulus]|uniref:HMA domain-containing protein n=1 Tax=Eucalyptus globulus TaxID=34317 RepID=A0ABD3IKE0_EUCGL
MNVHISRFCCFGPQSPRSKALKVVAGFPVQSVAWDDDQDQLKVTGDVNAINLTSLFRKKFEFAELVSTSEDKIVDKIEDNSSKTKDLPPLICSCPYVERFYYLEAPL